MKIIFSIIELKLIFILAIFIKLGGCLKLKQIFDNTQVAFPNMFQAPTMGENLDKFTVTKPKLSASLNELDPKKKLKLSQYLEFLHYALFNLTKSEGEQIFYFADKNHDDLLDLNDWIAFNTLYTYPFEACDTNKDYVLDEPELKKCLEHDPKMKAIKFQVKNQDDVYKTILTILSSKGGDRLNFADYLILRRALFGWVNCQSNDEFITQSDFACALRIAVPNKYQLKLDQERIFITGLKIANDHSLTEMNFLVYLNTIHTSFVFSVLAMPHDNPWIEKAQFLKAIREQRYPTHLSESDVNVMYELTDTNPYKNNKDLSYESFSFFYNAHRLFVKYSKTRAFQINFKEFSSLLDDNIVPLGIVIAIDSSSTNFTEAQYIEVSMSLQRARVKEQDFYFSFKSKESQMTEDMYNFFKSTKVTDDFYSFYDKPAVNQTNRQIFFSTMCGSDKNYWTKDMLFKSFQFSNIFSEMIQGKRWVLNVGNIVRNLPTLYDTLSPPVSLKNRQAFSYFKFIPKEISIDVLNFLAIHISYQKLTKNDEENDLINETDLKIILKDFGMINMPDTVIDLAIKGHDTLSRRVYTPKEVIKNISIIQSLAGDSVRNKEYFSLYGLKANNDVSRKFPPEPRRFMASPFA